MIDLPDDLYYTREHAWVSVNGRIATIGITDYAQEEAGNIIYVDMPAPDDQIEADDTLIEIESTVRSFDVSAPVSGIVLEINEELEDSPELLNDDPYTNWILKMEIADPEELEELMDASDYRAGLD